MNAAVVKLAEAAAGGGRPQRGAAREPLKVLGKHPRTEAEIKLMEGRYGAYVTDGETNATLPKSIEPGRADAGGSRAADRRARGGGAAEGQEEEESRAEEEAAREEDAAKNDPPGHGDELGALHALIERAYRGDSAKAGWTHEADLLAVSAPTRRLGGDAGRSGAASAGREEAAR